MLRKKMEIAKISTTPEYWRLRGQGFTGVIHFEHSMFKISFFYLKNGDPHREDGPAHVFCSGEKEWFLNGIKVTAQQVFDQLTPEQQEKAVWEINEWR